MKKVLLFLFAVISFVILTSANASVTDCDPETVTVSNAVSSIVVESLGARIISWRRHGCEMLWMPKRKVVKGWVHGGAPVCWPRHGRRELPDSPIHGVAWKTRFKVLSVQIGNEVSSIELGCRYGDLSLVYRIVLDDALRFEMRTENRGTEPTKVVSALHPYFRIGDISKVSVNDITFDGPFDKGFPCSIGDEYRMDDRLMGRKLVVCADEAKRFVVWTPWTKLESGIENGIIPLLDIGEYRSFLCVEPVSDSWESVDFLSPGDIHVFRASFRVE